MSSNNQNIHCPLHQNGTQIRTTAISTLFIHHHQHHHVCSNQPCICDEGHCCLDICNKSRRFSIHSHTFTDILLEPLYATQQINLGEYPKSKTIFIKLVIEVIYITNLCGLCLQVLLNRLGKEPDVNR